MEKIIRNWYNDRSVEMLHRIFSKKENHFMNGLWTGTAHKMVK